MLKNFYELPTIPLPIADQQFLENRYNFDNIKRGHWIESENLTNFLGEDIIRYLTDKNLTVPKIEIFYTAPYYTTNWHIDINPPVNLAKLNWVFCRGVNFMQWGNTDIDSSDLQSSTNCAGTSYLNCNNKISNVSDQCHIKNAAIVNIGVPHRVINASPYKRWCVSAILWQIFPRSRLSWEDALTIF